jgi:hypothetical protein
VTSGVTLTTAFWFTNDWTAAYITYRCHRKVCCFLVSMVATVGSTSMIWFPWIYSLYFRLPRNVFVNSFPRNGSTYHSIFKLTATASFISIPVHHSNNHSTIQWYTGCPRRNVPDFGRVFLMLKYTDITRNTYGQSWTVTEVMAREKCGLLSVPRTIPISWEVYLFDLDCGHRYSISAVFVAPALKVNYTDLKDTKFT